MKPKEVACPICSRETKATIWGMKIVGKKTVNYVRYIYTSCGCTIYYTGTEDFWDDII